jgi:hypothetical protein
MHVLAFRDIPFVGEGAAAQLLCLQMLENSC